MVEQTAHLEKQFRRDVRLVKAMDERMPRSRRLDSDMRRIEDAAKRRVDDLAKRLDK